MSETLLLNECLLPEGAVNVSAPEPSDDTIIERVRDGDVNAFEVLVRRYDRWVFGIVARHVARDQVAEIAQEVFSQAYQSLPPYSPRRSLAAGGRSLGHLNSSFRQWLATIAARRCCDYWRVVNRHPTFAISNLSDEDREQMERTCEAVADEASHSEMERDKMQEASRQAMDRLEANDQTILKLLYWEDYSLAETAAILGYSPGNVRIRASRARARLRQRMHPSAGDGRFTVPVQPAYPSNRTDERLSLESTLVPA